MTDTCSRLTPQRSAPISAPSHTWAIEEANTRLQTMFMKDVPLIPLWYNGIWAQYSDRYWTNWPSSTGGQYLPVMWRGYFEMTGIDMIDHLQPAH